MKAKAHSEPSAMDEAPLAETRRATRLVFFMAGATLAAWAPMVPFIKERMQAGSSLFGLLLLCFGSGAILSMPLAGILAEHFGCRRTIEIATVCAFLALICIANVSTPERLAILLALFGGAVGSLDVGINMQAALVQKAARKNVMSGFHGLFSGGGIVGAAVTSGLLSLGFKPAVAVICIVVPLGALLLYARPALLLSRNSKSSLRRRFEFPDIRLAVLGTLCFVLFLTEGSVLDWSALFLIEKKGFPASHSGLGFVAFSSAMTLARLFGDRVISIVGRRLVMLLGPLLAAVGYLLLILTRSGWFALAWFILIGVGIAAIVPMLFTFASESSRSHGHVISFLTVFGYAGLLAGPAFIGYTIEHLGFNWAFGGIALLLVGVAACFRVSPQRQRARRAAAST